MRFLKGASDKTEAVAESLRAQLRLPSRLTPFLWILYSLVSFVVFFLLTFPMELVLQRAIASIEQTASLRVRYKTGQWTWSRGWSLEDIAIDTPATASVQLTRLTLQPSLIGLLYGQLFPLTLSARLYGGAAHGTLAQTGDMVDIRFTLDELALAQLPLPDPWSQGQFAGNLTLNGVLHGEGKDLNAWSGSLTATLTEGSVKAGKLAAFPIPAIQAMRAHAQTRLKNGQVEIADLTLETDGVTARLQGAIILRFPLKWSSLDVQLTTQTLGSPPPPLAMLVSLLPTVPGTAGERRATITGTFAAPVMR